MRSLFLTMHDFYAMPLDRIMQHRDPSQDGETVQGIAAVLARESGRTPAECWGEALSLHRVAFEREVLPLEEEE